MRAAAAVLGFLSVTRLAAGDDLQACHPGIEPIKPPASGLIIERCIAVGDVRVRFTITPEGEPSDVAVESSQVGGGEFLTRCAAEIAMDTVKRFRFAPQEYACHSVATITFPRQ